MKSEVIAFWAPRAGAIVAIAAVLSALLIVVLRPLLERYAMARPNARSSHKITDAARRRNRGCRRDNLGLRRDALPLAGKRGRQTPASNPYSPRSF